MIELNTREERQELRKLIKQCRHPKERLLFRFASAPIIIVLLIFLIAWAFYPKALERYIAEDVLDQERTIDLLIGASEENTANFTIESFGEFDMEYQIMKIQSQIITIEMEIEALREEVVELTSAEFDFDLRIGELKRKLRILSAKLSKFGEANRTTAHGESGQAALSQEEIEDILNENVALLNEIQRTVGEINSEISQLANEQESHKIRELLIPLIGSPILPIFLILVFIALVFSGTIQIYGEYYANGIRLSEQQFPNIFQLYKELALNLGFKKIPDIVLYNSNGELNAAACTIPFVRNAAFISSDIFHKCIDNNDMKSISFILGHELGHIKLKHTKWWFILLTAPLYSLNILASALSRAKEYSCDKIGSHLSGDTEGRSLVMLAAGKHNYRDVDIEALVEDHERTKFSTIVVNLFRSHPVSSWRIFAIRHRHHGGIIFRNKRRG